MNEKTLEKDDSTKIMEVGHMINDDFNPEKSLKIVFADKDGKEKYHILLDAEHNYREGPMDKYAWEYGMDTPGEKITKKDLHNMVAYAAYDNNQQVGYGESTEISAIIVDSKTVFDRDKANAKDLAMCVSVEQGKVKALTITDLAGKALVDETYNEKSTVLKDKEKIETLLNQAEYIVGFDMKEDLRALKESGINLPKEKKYLDRKDHYEFVHESKIAGKTKAEQWQNMNKEEIEFGTAEKFKESTRSQAHALIYDFDTCVRKAWGSEPDIPTNEKKVLKRLDDILEKEKEKAPRKGIHRKAPSNKLER